MVKLLSRIDLEERIPPLKKLEFSYWAFTKARIRPRKRKIIKGRVYNFYTFKAARKLEAVLRKEKPHLFKRQSKPKPECAGESSAA